MRYSSLFYYGGVNLKNFKILLVEDEKQMSMFIEMELSHEGYKVDIAYDGREGLK